MEVDYLKVAEYLRVYNLIMAKCFTNLGLKPYDAFIELINNNETNLNKEEFNNIFLIKNFYSITQLLGSARDYFQKGLNQLDYDNKETLLDKSIPINQKCFENFKDADIIKYIRGTLLHTSTLNQNIFLDPDRCVIRVKYQNTKATKGPNAGKVVPFEAEIDSYHLLSLASLPRFESNIIGFTGIRIKNDAAVAKKVEKYLVYQKLREIANNTVYDYCISKPLDKNSKKRIIMKHRELNETKDYREFDKFTSNYLRINKTAELSQGQKDTLHFNLCQAFKKKEIFELDGSNPRSVNSLPKESLKTLFPLFLEDEYEYQGLKVIPTGHEKEMLHLSSMLLSYAMSTGLSYIDAMQKVLYDRDTYHTLSYFIGMDEEERKMFANHIIDTQYLLKEGQAIYYRFMMETFVNDREITINKKQYDSSHIRNAFTHGGWYFNDKDNKWELFDRDILYEYGWNYHKSIKADAFEKFISELHKSLKSEEEQSLN